MSYNLSHTFDLQRTVSQLSVLPIATVSIAPVPGEANTTNNVNSFDLDSLDWSCSGEYLLNQTSGTIRQSSVVPYPDWRTCVWHLDFNTPGR
jgi:hypothetical protein